MVSFFHISKGKEMGVCEGENEEKSTARDLQNLVHHFSQPLYGKHLHVTKHFDVYHTNSGLSYLLNGTFTGHCFSDVSCPHWEQASRILL